MKDYKFVTIIEIGRGWFEVDGAKKRMKKEEAIVFDEARVAEAEAKRAEEEAKKVEVKKVARKADPEIGMTNKLSQHITIANMNKQTPKLITINCCDCGAERIIKIQDQFQVKRCPECQKAHRNAIRRAKRAEKKAQQANQQ